MAKAKAAKPLPPAIAFSFKTLCKLLGKPVDDPAVTRVIAKAGTVKIDADFIVAKDAGFDFALEHPAGAKRNAKKVLGTLFLFCDGGDGHRGYRGLPAPFAFLDRPGLRAVAPPPDESFAIGKGVVPVDAPEVHRDTWYLDGLVLAARYRRKDNDRVGHFTVTLPDEARGGQPLETHPLHFEAKPADAPEHAALVGMGLLVAWAADRFGLPAKHATSEPGRQLAARAITPVAFLRAACNSTLTTLDVDPKLGDFLWGYTSRMFIGDEYDPREPTERAIKKLLRLERADERAYTDDFLGTFAGAVKNPFYVPDSWDAVDRIAPILDARWADFQATKLLAPPDLAIYENAAKLRDGQKVTPQKAEVAPAGKVDDQLAEDLIALLDLPLTDERVKRVLGRAGMPVGKRIDQQANPALGISYMGAKFEIAGKRVLGVEDVWFYGAGYKTYVRGMGTEVVFRGFPGKLPHGLKIGAPRAAVVKALGKPTDARDDHDFWKTKTRRITAQYGKNRTLKMFHVGRPVDA